MEGKPINHFSTVTIENHICKPWSTSEWGPAPCIRGLLSGQGKSRDKCQSTGKQIPWVTCPQDICAWIIWPPLFPGALHRAHSPGLHTWGLCTLVHGQERCHMTHRCQMQYLKIWELGWLQTEPQLCHLKVVLLWASSSLFMSLSFFKCTCTHFLGMFCAVN